jgi:hypothetical protein
VTSSTATNAAIKQAIDVRRESQAIGSIQPLVGGGARAAGFEVARDKQHKVFDEAGTPSRIRICEFEKPLGRIVRG